MQSSRTAAAFWDQQRLMKYTEESKTLDRFPGNKRRSDSVFLFFSFSLRRGGGSIRYLSFSSFSLFRSNRLVLFSFSLRLSLIPTSHFLSLSVSTLFLTRSLNPMFLSVHFLSTLTFFFRIRLLSHSLIPPPYIGLFLFRRSSSLLFFRAFAFIDLIPSFPSPLFHQSVPLSIHFLFPSLPLSQPTFLYILYISFTALSFLSLHLFLPLLFSFLPLPFHRFNLSFPPLLPSLSSYLYFLFPFSIFFSSPSISISLPALLPHPNIFFSFPFPSSFIPLYPTPVFVFSSPFSSSPSVSISLAPLCLYLLFFSHSPSLFPSHSISPYFLSFFFISFFSHSLSFPFYLSFSFYFPFISFPQSPYLFPSAFISLYFHFLFSISFSLPNSPSLSTLFHLTLLYLSLPLHLTLLSLSLFYFSLPP